MKRNLKKTNGSFLALVLSLCFILPGCNQVADNTATTLPPKEPVTVVSTVESAVPAIDNTTLFSYEGKEPKTLYAYYSENEDTIGWLTIPGIETDNIVMLGQKDKAYARGEDGQNHYLNYDFNHNARTAGELYIDHRDQIGYNTLSQNITVYGHHMRDGTMLAGIDRYKSKSYFEEHQYFTFHTLWGTYHYRVFAIFMVNLKVAEDKAFDFRQPEYESEEVFLTFIDEIRQRSYYQTDVEVKGDDKIMNLVTCTYPTGNPGYDNARLILMGRLCTDPDEIAAAEQALAANQ